MGNASCLFEQKLIGFVFSILFTILLFFILRLFLKSRFQFYILITSAFILLETILWILQFITGAYLFPIPLLGGCY